MLVRSSPALGPLLRTTSRSGTEDLKEAAVTRPTGSNQSSQQLLALAGLAVAAERRLTGAAPSAPSPTERAQGQGNVLQASRGPLPLSSLVPD